MSTCRHNSLKFTISVTIIVIALVPFNKLHVACVPTTPKSPIQYQKGLETSGSIRDNLIVVAAADMPRKNVVCSPLAALIPLAKLALAASSDTLTELLAAVGVTKKSQLSPMFKPLMDSIPNLKGVSLKLSSKIYLSTQHQLKPSFAKAAKDIFKSTVDVIDFKASGGIKAAQLINIMINHETGGKFDKMVRPEQIPSGNESVILVSAVNFVAEWREKFPKATLGDFHSLVGKEKVFMMSKIGTYNYVMSKALSAQIIEIPFKSEATLIIILPLTTHGGLQELLDDLVKKPNLLEKELQEMIPRRVALTFPKFKVHTELNLVKLYKKLGLRHIFTKGLTGIIKSDKIYKSTPVTITAAVQQISIRIAESETVALPATEGSVSPPDPPKMTADHPFLYFIKVGREPLFAGVYVDPS